MGTHRLCADAHAALFLRSPAFIVLFNRMYFACFALQPHNLLRYSSVLRVSCEGGKCSLHGKTLRWRIVLHCNVMQTSFVDEHSKKKNNHPSTHESLERY